MKRDHGVSICGQRTLNTLSTVSGPWQRQEAVILARDLETTNSAASQPQDGASWGGVHITALYAEEAHIKAGDAAAVLNSAAPENSCHCAVNSS